MDTLFHEGLLRQTDGQYPVLNIASEGREVLSGRRTVHRIQVRPKPASPEMRPEAGYDESLFERLRRLRRSLAEEKGVPPFVIFSDRTLREMASSFPVTERGLLMVTGVGEVKLSQYGSAFIEEITAYVRDNPEAPERYLKRPEDREQAFRHESPLPAGGSGTVEETYRLLNQGLTLQEAASHRGLTPGTIVAHIERLLAAGRALDIDCFIAPERRKEIESLFTRLRTDALKPVVVESNNTVSYDEARLARAWMKRKTPK
jgi:ATP-dependent DNA helicase RecQ